MAEELGLISSGLNIASGIASLTRKPSVPTVAGAAQSGLKIGFGNSLTTPGYGFNNGELYKSDLGESYNKALGGFLIGGGLDAMRSRQVGTALGRIAPIRAGIGDSLTSIADLRAQVRPGFGALTDSRVTAIRDAAAESIGNLRDSLARRGVMGSSFADDSIARTRLAYAREEGNARAEAKVAEISAQSQLVAQELNAFAQAMGLDQYEASIYQQDISNAITQASAISAEMNRQLQEFGVAGNIANNVGALVNQTGMAQAEMQLLAAMASNRSAAGGVSLINQGLSGLGDYLRDN